MLILSYGTGTLGESIVLRVDQPNQDSIWYGGKDHVDNVYGSDAVHEFAD